MRKITGTYIFKTVSLILILAMVLSGCGKSNKTESISDTVTSVPGVMPDSSPATNGADLSGTAVESESTAATFGEDALFAKDEASMSDMMMYEAAVSSKAEVPMAMAEGMTGGADYYGEYGDYEVYSDRTEGEPGDWIDEPAVPIDPVEPWEPEPIIEPVAPRAGLLTAGEWNDNLHMDFLRNLLANGQEQNYKEFFNAWNLKPFNRIVVHVTDESGADLGNVMARAYDINGKELGSACTDNSGIAYIFYNLTGNTEDIPSLIHVQHDDEIVGYDVVSADLMDDSVAEITFVNIRGTSKKLDLMMVVDTTGSMGDEIQYLQTELEDVITRVSRDNANLPIRLSVNFYRDMDDDYVVRSHPFSSNIDEQMAYLRVEYADGGGDYEEAVELALEDAVNNHDWDADSVKIMFLVLDAPPHNTAAIRESLAATLAAAQEKGIRIIPIASSGVDKSTEFLLRTLAMTTGGTYTFLTDDSGIGGAHLEPTIGSYEVEYLNDLMVRIIDGYLK